MDNTEVKIMVLTLEHERMVKHYVEEGRIRRALAQQPARALRPGRDGVPKHARGMAGGVRRIVRRWLPMPWDVYPPRVSPSAPARIALMLLVALLALPMAQTASPVGAKNRSRTVTRSFSNPTAIELPESESDPVSGSLYPSLIVVGGLKNGKIRDVNLILRDLSHTYPDDVEVLLVGPRGQTAVVMAHVGGPDDVDAVTLRLDDEAAAPLPDNQNENLPLQSGTFQPTYVIGDPLVFNAPAPSATENVALSVFDGANPNGTWRLFVQDLEETDPGTFAGGWTLELKVQTKAKKKR